MLHEKLLEKIIAFVRVTRLPGWTALIKAQVAFALVYLLISEPSNAAEALIVFIVYVAISLTLAHMLNSIGDFEYDVKAGKHRGIQEFPKWFLYSTLFICALLMILIPTLFGTAETFVGLIALFLAVFYSMKPIKFKERGLLGPASAAMGNSMLIILFALLVNGPAVFAAFLAVTMFFRNMAVELGHQLEEFNSDKKVKEKNWAQQTGIRNTRSAVRISVILFLLSLCCAFFFGVKEGLLTVLVIGMFSFYEMYIYTL